MLAGPATGAAPREGSNSAPWQGGPAAGAGVCVRAEEALGGRDGPADHAGDRQRDAGERTAGEQRAAAGVEGHRAGRLGKERALPPSAGPAGGARAAALGVAGRAHLLHPVERNCHLEVAAEAGQGLSDRRAEHGRVAAVSGYVGLPSTGAVRQWPLVMRTLRALVSPALAKVS